MAGVSITTQHYLRAEVDGQVTLEIVQELITRVINAGATLEASISINPPSATQGRGENTSSVHIVWKE